MKNKTQTNSKYNSYGVLKTKQKPNITPNTLVEYIDTKMKNNKRIKVKLHGIWDGNKVVFNDKDKTTVRTVWWLTKIK